MKAEASYVDTYLPSPYGRTDARRTALWIVLHTIECAQSDASALGIARYFKSNPRSVSSHYVLGSDLLIQCVPEKTVAYAAGPTGNLYGIHVELVGRAAQTRDQWTNDYGTKQRARLVRLVRDVASRNGIPLERVGVEGAKSKQRGILDHDTLSKAYKDTNHWDIGQGFPWDTFLEELAS